ncbi:MAG: pectin acetylesterase-family hydrolase, partial [Myxococcota bacterium]
MLLQNNGLTACVAAVFWMVGTLGCGEESSDSSDMADAAVDVEVNTDGDDSDTGTATMDTEPMVASACTVAASEGMRTCVRSVNTAWTQCFANGDAPCAPDNAEVSAALMTLQGRLEADCEEGAFGALSTQALVGRLRNACRSEAASLAWRTYGGPQGAVWAEATDETKACLTASHAAAATLMDDGLGSISACLTEGNCDPTTVEADRQMSAGTALSAIAEGCSTGLDTLIAVTPEVYLDRAAHQVDCMAAAAHAQTAPLALKCGPSFAAFDPPRGEYIQVTVDGDVWGTQCGDGSPYVFHVRLAPEGERLDRLVIGLQGGGVCVFGSDCGPRLESNPGLFTAMDDEPPTTGITSNDPDESPFARWTKVYLPYCNQDV